MTTPIEQPYLALFRLQLEWLYTPFANVQQKLAIKLANSNIKVVGSQNVAETCLSNLKVLKDNRTNDLHPFNEFLKRSSKEQADIIEKKPIFNRVSTKLKLNTLTEKRDGKIFPKESFISVASPFFEIEDANWVKCTESWSSKKAQICVEDIHEALNFFKSEVEFHWDKYGHIEIIRASKKTPEGQRAGKLNYDFWKHQIMIKKAEELAGHSSQGHSDVTPQLVNVDNGEENKLTLPKIPSDIHHVVEDIAKYYNQLIELLDNQNAPGNHYYEYLTECSTYKISDFLKNGQRRVPKEPVIEGWIKEIEKTIELKVATPKHKVWFKDAYEFAGIPGKNEVELNSCFDERHIKDPIKCTNCIGDSEQTLTVNYSSDCLRKLVDLFYYRSDQQIATLGFKKCRFMLAGYAGEGKSAWLNNFVSTTNDYMWIKKLIYIKIPTTDTKFYEAFKTLRKKSIDEQDDDGTFASKFWDNVKSTRLLRMIKEHHLTCETVFISEYDLFEVARNIPKDDALSYHQGFELEGYYRLSYKSNPAGIPISPEEKIRLLSFAKNINCNDITFNNWENAIDKLCEKSESTFTRGMIEDIENICNGLVNNNLIKPESLTALWNKPYKREKRFHLDHEVTILTAKIVEYLIDKGFRFLVIVDGLDVHHNMNDSEITVLEILRTFIDHQFAGKNLWAACHILTTRSSTIETYMLNMSQFRGQTRGSFQQLKLKNCDFFNIVKHRLDLASKKYKEEFFKNFHLYFLNMISLLVDDAFNRRMHPVLRPDRDHSSFDMLVMLFRGNLRKSLNFLILYVREIIFACNKAGFIYPGMTKRDEENVILEMYSHLFGKNYIFWSGVICRNGYFHYPLYGVYTLKNDANGLQLIRKTSTHKGSELYGTILNIFDFVPLSLSLDGGKQLNVVRNKLFIRLRIIQLLNIQAKSCEYIEAAIAYKYKISPIEASWEIEELILSGLIEIKKDEINAYFDENNPDKIIPHKHCKLQVVSAFWNVYNHILTDRFVFRGLILSFGLPDDEMLAYSSYTTFESVRGEYLENDRWSEDNKLEIIQASASEIITTVTMSTYFDYIEKHNMLNIAEYDPIKIRWENFIKQHSIKTEIIDKLEKVNPQGNSKEVVKLLREYLVALHANIKTVKVGS